MTDPFATPAARAASAAERRLFAPGSAEPLALAFEDELTGLPNRRYLSHLLREDWPELCARCAPLAVAMIDLDGFKQVNDRYGHAAGDHVLGVAAELLRQGFRSADLVLRYGGDEFVVLLPNLAPNDAAALAERVRERLARHGFRTPTGEAMEASLSFSVGVAGFPEDGHDGSDVLAAADQRLYADKRQRSAARAPQVAARDGRARVSAVAVLPLRNLSRDPAQDYFAEGMTEELIVALARCRSLRVLSRSSVMRYRDSALPAPAIAAELGVDALIEGSVLRVGERVRIAVQIVDGLTDSHRWADSLDGALGDVLDLQRAMAERVVAELRPEAPAPAPVVSTPSSASTVAYEAYLKGRYHWNRLTVAAIERAIACFEEALAAEPNHGPSLAGLADCYVSLQFLGGAAATLAPAARAAALHAVQAAPDLAAAHGALATVRFFFDWDWTGAESAFARALEIDPHSPSAHQGHAYLQSALGLHDAAIASSRQVRDRDPLGLMANVDLGWRCYFARRHAQAARQLRLTLELDGNFANAHWCLGNVLLELGQHTEAIAALERAVALSPGSAQPLGSLGYAFARSGRHSEARIVLRQIDDMATDAPVSPWLHTLVLGALGERAAALDALEAAHAAGTPAMVWLGVHPELDPLRGEPRFTRLLQRLGLA